jgi:pilus assembly protein CpaF
MLQAMNTGHEGSLTTVHANSPRDALSRVENMVSLANLNIPERAMRQQIASAIHAIVQVTRMSDGSRRVSNICEVMGIEGNVITTQDIFVLERRGVTDTGRIRATFRATGIRPRFSDKLSAAGLRLAASMFDSQVEV